MTFSNFAGSLLLALTLASLSALAPHAPRPGQAVPNQSVGAIVVTPAAASDTRLAMADARPSAQASTRLAAAQSRATVPNAGEIVPEAGQ